VSDYLPPIVTKLDGDLSGLAKKLAEAEGLVDEYGRRVERTVTEHSERAGEQGGRSLASKFEQEASKGFERLRDERGRFRSAFEDMAGDVGDGGGKSMFSRMVGALTNVPKIVGGALMDGVEGGVQKAGNWASENPVLAGGIAAGILLGAPAIGGALTAVVGGGALAAGVLLAAKDPRVGAAWGEFADSAMIKLKGVAGVFVDPLVRGASRFEETFDRILPHLRTDFGYLAPVLDKLIGGASGFIERLMPGIDAMSRQSGPLTMLADELPRIGGAISTAFKLIADGSSGGTHALQDTIRSVEGAIIAAGAFTLALEKWYDAETAAFMALWDFPGAVDRMTGALAGNAQTTAQVTPAVQSASAAVSDFIAAAHGAADATDEAKNALEKYINEALAMQDADLALKRGLLDIADAFDRSNGSMNTNTRLGLAAREAMQQQNRYGGIVHAAGGLVTEPGIYRGRGAARSSRSKRRPSRKGSYPSGASPAPTRMT
jgi:hypothetical protein